MLVFSVVTLCGHVGRNILHPSSGLKRCLLTRLYGIINRHYYTALTVNFSFVGPNVFLRTFFHQLQSNRYTTRTITLINFRDLNDTFYVFTLPYGFTVYSLSKEVTLPLYGKAKKFYISVLKASWVNKYNLKSFLTLPEHIYFHRNKFRVVKVPQITLFRDKIHNLLNFHMKWNEYHMSDIWMLRNVHKSDNNNKATTLYKQRQRIMAVRRLIRR